MLLDIHRSHIRSLLHGLGSQGEGGPAQGQDVSLYYHGQGFRETGARVGVRVGVSVRVSVKLSFWVSFLVTHLYLRTALEDQVRFYKVR